MGNMQRSLQQSTKLQRLSTPVWFINSPKRRALVEEAAYWIGTPFHHQGRTKDAGCDCIGLIIGLARQFDFDKIVGFDDYKAYSKNPNGHEMSKIMKLYLQKIKLEEVLPGDILHLSFIQYPQHVVMLMPDACIIHAHEPDNKVIHHRLNDWWLSRVMGAYRYRGLN